MKASYLWRREKNNRMVFMSRRKLKGRDRKWRWELILSVGNLETYCSIILLKYNLKSVSGDTIHRGIRLLEAIPYQHESQCLTWGTSLWFGCEMVVRDPSSYRLLSFLFACPLDHDGKINYFWSFLTCW